MMAEAFPTADIKEPESGGMGDGADMCTRIMSYPCLFHLQSTGITTNRLEELKRKIKGIQKSDANYSGTFIDSDLPSEDRTSGQQYTNILVYVLWRLKRVEEAEQLALEAIRAHPKSILTRTNMAYIIWRKGEESRVEEQLQALTELNENSAAEFDDLLIEARLGIAFFYYLCEGNFLHRAGDIYEDILQERPGHDKTKLFLARVLKKLEPSGNFHANGTQSLERAIDLLNDIKTRPENNAQLRGEAAAELGEIFSYTYHDDRCDTVKSKSESLDLDADQCFKEALDLAKDNAKVLVKAAMHYRLHDQEEKATEILKQLIYLQPMNATGHYQLGLILQQRALKARRQSARRSNSQSPGNLKLETALQRSKCPIFSRDSVVEHAMTCFHEAEKLDYGEYVAVWYNLGLMHRALGEYRDAMCQFLKVLKKGLSTLSTFTGRALEQSSLVMLNVEQTLTVPEQKREFKDAAQDMLNMAAILFSRKLLNTQKHCESSRQTWKSFFTLNSTLTNNFNLPKDEAQVLLFLKRHGDTLLSCRYELSHITEAKAEDVQFLENGLHDLQSDQHYLEAVLYVALLKVTDMRRALDTWRDKDLVLHVHVQAARKLLSTKLGKKISVYYQARSHAATFLFRWAFEDRFYAAAAQHKPQDENDNNDHDLGSTEDLHVLIVHESRNIEDAAALERVLRDTCGLKTRCAYDSPDHTTDSSTFCRTVQAAQVVLFLVTTDSVQSGFQRLIHNTVTMATHNDAATDASQEPKPKPTRNRALSVVKGNATLPAELQDRPSLPWDPDLEKHYPKRPLSEGQVSAVCNLFCFLFGLNMQ